MVSVAGLIVRDEQRVFGGGGGEAMAKTSAGLLMYRVRGGGLEVFLVHPGGPFYATKDDGAWTIPKGEFGHEDPLEAAQREFKEETGFEARGPFLMLGTLKQAGGKLVSAWAFEGDCDPAKLKSNTFEMEWPRGSGTVVKFPEVDRGAWFTLRQAGMKILAAQKGFLDELARRVVASGALTSVPHSGQMRPESPRRS